MSVGTPLSDLLTDGAHSCPKCGRCFLEEPGLKIHLTVMHDTDD